MKKSIRIFSFILSLVFIMSFTGCAANSGKKSVEFTDQAGRTVTLDKPAEKVVSCYYITSYAMLSLGLGDKVVGIEKKADTRPIYKMAYPSFLDLPQVGTMKECNVEAIAALEPDLVLMPSKLIDYAETLEELGIAVMVVNPETEESLCEMLTLIGKACGAEDKAEKLISFYDEKTAEINALVKDEASPLVYIGGNSSYMTTAPKGMYQAGLIALAGGDSVGAELEGNYWTEVSYESILAADPEIFIIPSDAAYSAQDILSDAELAGIRAVENGAVYEMPSAFEAWDAPVPSWALGASWLVSVLHPNKLSREDFASQVCDFYKTFYGFTPADDVIATLYD